MNALLRLVQSFFFHDSAEMTKRKDGGGPDVVFQVVCTKPGLKKKIGSVGGPPAGKQRNLHARAHTYTCTDVTS